MEDRSSRWIIEEEEPETPKLNGSNGQLDKHPVRIGSRLTVATYII